LPIKPTFIKDGKASPNAFYGENYDFESIAAWFATGFFLGNNTFFKEVKKIPPSYEFINGELSGPNWEWHYKPKNISFNQALDEFSHIIQKLINEDIKKEDKIILPLSGGLDSRTLAACSIKFKNLYSYSYEFNGGTEEIKYAEQIANALNLKFKKYFIRSGYFWRVIEKIADCNQCFIESTHSRPWAVIDEVSKLGNKFLLGHGGDFLFNNDNIKSSLDQDEQVNFIIKKIVKNDGAEIAELLWNEWGLNGNFMDYFKDLIYRYLSEIKIDDLNSKFRAFKAMHYIPNWSNMGMKVFYQWNDISVPYFSDDMCKFICTIPENYLAERKLQIEFLKRKNPILAQIPWQAYDLNLYNYKFFNSIYFHKRVIRKIKSTINGKKILRNWELQFLGENNDEKIKDWFFNKNLMNDLIPNKIYKNYYEKFKNKPLDYAHSLSMLLTSILFNKRKNNV